MNENKKWNWNNPVTWKQSILLSVIGAVISVTWTLIYFYGNDIVEKIDDIWNWVRNLKRKE